MKLERTDSLWNRDNRNSINRNWDKLEGVLKSIDALVANGQLTPQQYAQLLTHLNGFIQKGELSVDDINKNLGKIDQSFLSDELLSQITGNTPISSVVADGSVTSEKLANFAVTPDKTTFFNTTGNLFDGNYLNGMLVSESWGSTLRPVYNYDEWEGKIAVLPIEPGKAYTVSINRDMASVFRVGTHSTESPFDSYPTSNSLRRVIHNTNAAEGTMDDPTSSISFVAEEGDNFVFIYVSNNGVEVPLQVFEAMIDGSYVPPPNENSVRPSMTTFFSSGDGHNLFNGDYHNGILFYVATHDYGEVLYLRNNYESFRGKVAIVPVQPNTTYAAKVHDTPTNDVFRIGLMDDYPEFTDSNLLSYTVDEFVTEQRTYNKKHVFTTGESTRFALIYVSNDGTEPRLMVNQGANYDNFVAGIYIPAHYLEIPSDSGTSGDIQKSGKFTFTGNFNEYYSEPALENYFSNPTTLTPTNYHDEFKQLIDNHPIASRTLLGNDDFGNPLYKYEIKPTEYYKGSYWNLNPGNEGQKLDSPKIMVTSGVHGREKNVSYAVYYLFKAILENPNNLDELDSLKTNLHLIAIPIASPTGFIDGTYENRAGTNINRDFPPYGEVTQGETKLVKNVIDDNTDMSFFIDYHNMQARHDLIGYSLTDDEFFKHSTLNMYRAVGRHWQKKDSRFPQAINHRWAYTVASNEGTVGRYVKDVLGIPSTLIEIPLSSQWVSEGQHGPVNTQMGVDILMNTIFACIRSKQ